MTLLAAAAAAAKTVPALKLPAALPTVVPAPIQQPVAPTVIPQTWFQTHASWLTHGLAGLFLIAAIGLIVMLAIQTTKQEGLSGTLGGRVESAYARPGAEEQLKRITGTFAVLFVIIGTILSLTGI
jgi:preprotein translocase subunit SecG